MCLAETVSSPDRIRAFCRVAHWREMAQLEALVGEATAEECDLEAALFGETDARVIAGMLEEYLTERLAPIDDALFYRRGTGIVVGLRLVNGLEAVLKAHRWRVSLERLTAVQVVQAELARSGLPAPSPLLSPTPLGSAIVTVEELLPGAPAGGSRPEIRREMATGLFGFVSAARAWSGAEELGVGAFLEPAEGSPYPEPHDLRFDFAATAAGADWIDELAWQARRVLEQVSSPLVVGHLDWQAGNLGFLQDRLAAIYDWDSVSRAPEPVIVGVASAEFSTDWSRGVGPPSTAEMQAFIAEYEAARGSLFEDGERELLGAANLLTCAYGARCQHSDGLLGTGRSASGAGGWIELLNIHPFAGEGTDDPSVESRHLP